jgi:hypothetical protein
MAWQLPWQRCTDGTIDCCTFQGTRLLLVALIPNNLTRQTRVVGLYLRHAQPWCLCAPSTVHRALGCGVHVVVAEPCAVFSLFCNT